MLALSRWKIIAVTLSVIFGLLYTIPNLLPQSALDAYPKWLPHERVNLGLDLQGGSYLLLEVDVDALRKEKLVQLTEGTREALRTAQIQFSGLAEVNGVITVQITDAAKLNDALNLLRRQVANAPDGSKLANMRTLANQTIELSLDPATLQATSAQAVTRSIEIVRRRIDALGTREPSIAPQGTNRIVVQVPGESDPSRIEAVIGQTAKLTFQMVDDTVTTQDIVNGLIPPGDEMLPSEEGPPMVVRRRAVVTGEMLTRAVQGNDQNGRPSVNFTFNGEGSRRFGEVTSRNVGKLFAIVLDGKIISAPRINGPITGGSGEITGNFTVQSANDLAVLLQAGALPAPLKVEARSTVGAEVGADAVKSGAIALGIGAVAIFVFIILAYGSFGVYAAIALIVNILMMVGALTFFRATLTLPGIAGLILTLAVAVDANVLIYERIRDEARTGRTPFSAVDTGYQRALVSIIDANITTLISAIIMFLLGAGPVRGFAVTLIIGVLTSVFTAVVITQLLIGTWFKYAKPKKLPIA